MRIRLRELFKIKERSVQINIVYEMSYRKRFMILIAKTVINKSAIFEAISLLNSFNSKIILIIMSLKHI